MYDNINVIVEFIAIPPDLNIETFLSVPESFGRFKSNHVNKNKLLLIAKSLQDSPIFTISNTNVSTIYSCLTFLYILQELDLTISSILNITKPTTYYKDFLESGFFDNLKSDNIISDFVIVVVNLFPLMSGNLMEEALKSLINLEEFQKEVKQSIRIIKE